MKMISKFALVAAMGISTSTYATIRDGIDFAGVEVTPEAASIALSSTPAAHNALLQIAADRGHDGVAALVAAEDAEAVDRGASSVAVLNAKFTADDLTTGVTALETALGGQEEFDDAHVTVESLTPQGGGPGEFIDGTNGDEITAIGADNTRTIDQTDAELRAMAWCMITIGAGNAPVANAATAVGGDETTVTWAQIVEALAEYV